MCVCLVALLKIATILCSHSFLIWFSFPTSFYNSNLILFLALVSSLSACIPLYAALHLMSVCMCIIIMCADEKKTLLSVHLHSCARQVNIRLYFEHKNLGENNSFSEKQNPCICTQKAGSNLNKVWIYRV